MARVSVTENLQRHVAVPPADVPGETVGEVLEGLFARHPALRGYVLDDRGAVRHHMTLFVDGATVADRQRLSDAVTPDSEIHIMQALSGG